MSVRVHVVDPANIFHLDLSPQRTGWHDLYGGSADALNGNISRVFLTNIPQSIPSSGWQQDTDYTCGPSAMAIALGMVNDNEPHNWLAARELIDSDNGTWYTGIVSYLATKGYSCAYDGIGHDGQMSGSFYNDIINHLNAGKKVILVMHCPRTTYWTTGGHYIVLDAIDDGSGSSSSGSGSSSGGNVSSGGEIVRWNDLLNYPLFESEATARAQINLNNYTGMGLEVDGIIGYNTLRAMIMAVQIACNHDYNSGLVVDGYWGEATESALRGHYVRFGENQEMVRAVQILLLARGDDPGDIDASFGNGTDVAVRTFQKDTGLTVDGVAGFDTIRKLLFVI